MRVLLTDAANRVALAIARALGKAKIDIFVCEQARFAQKLPITFYSRFVKRKYLLPSIDKDKHFIQGITKLAERVDVVIPVATNTVLLLARFRDEIAKSGAKLLIPSFETIRLANSKERLVKFAQEIDIPTPRTFIPESPFDLDKISDELPFPMIIKLRNDEDLYLEPSARYALAKNRDDLRCKYMTLHQLKPYPIIQEYIVGSGFGFFAITSFGKPVAIFCHKRIREYPPTGGPSSCCISIYCEKLIEYGLRLLKNLSWDGPAMVEFKKDVRDNEYKLMELNPRFWGSLPLALYSGINFPYILCKTAVGERLPPIPRYKTGVKLRFLNLDLLATLISLKDPQKRGYYLTGFLKDLINPSIKEGLFNLDDPMPSLAYFFSKMI
jgi:predicted ATP-grasp superfamily ATP-dependent carboligase